MYNTGTLFQPSIAYAHRLLYRVIVLWRIMSLFIVVGKVLT